MSEIVLWVTGLPAPQGSKRAWVNKTTGRAQMVEQSGDKIGLWRQDVKEAARQALDVRRQWVPLEGPLEVSCLFWFPRPKSHFRTGRNARLLRDNAPGYPATRATGDLDKCLRSTWDALVTAGLFADDAQIVHTDTWQNYADHCLPGARITIRTLDHATAPATAAVGGAAATPETRTP